MHSVLEQPGLYKEILPQQQQNKQTKSCNNYLEYKKECRLQGIEGNGYKSSTIPSHKAE